MQQENNMDTTPNTDYNNMNEQVENYEMDSVLETKDLMILTSKQIYCEAFIHTDLKNRVLFSKKLSSH